LFLFQPREPYANIAFALSLLGSISFQIPRAVLPVRAMCVAPIVTPTQPAPEKQTASEDIANDKAETGAAKLAKRVRGGAKIQQGGQKDGLRKLDLYTERVTVLMSSEMKDEVDALARELQRGKRAKGERITANTVMRVAIRCFLQRFKVRKGEEPNNEEDLLSSANRHMDREARREGTTKVASVPEVSN
jgi:hypothetical protein